MESGLELLHSRINPHSALLCFAFTLLGGALAGLDSWMACGFASIPRYLGPLPCLPMQPGAMKSVSR